MFPPIFSIAAADSSVKAIFGAGVTGDPVRFWAFGDGPRAPDGTPAHGNPYATWQIVTGSPENYLDKSPDIDGHGVQIDVYAASISAVREGAQALRDCLQEHGYVTSWNGEIRDFPTGLYRVSFTMGFLTERAES